jgi:hypothetical protein
MVENISGYTNSPEKQELKLGQRAEMLSLRILS